MNLWTWLFPHRPCDIDHQQVRKAVHRHNNSMANLQAAVREDRKNSQKAKDDVLHAFHEFETKSDRILRMADEAIQFIEESKGREVDARDAKNNK